MNEYWAALIGWALGVGVATNAFLEGGVEANEGLAPVVAILFGTLIAGPMLCMRAARWFNGWAERNGWRRRA